MNYCPSCGTAINGANFCSSCGSPATVTIEKTGKKWKKLTVIGAGCIVGGLLGLALFGPIGALLFLIGLPVLIYTSIGKWWHHG